MDRTAHLAGARKEALTTLCQIAKDELPDGHSREFIIHIRDDTGPQPILTASLVLKIQERGESARNST